MISYRSDFRNSMLCAVVAMAALLLAWPFANIPFNDDWSWSFTVKQLLDTGHLVYNGWSSPPVIAQAYWGLLWAKVFGFSFNVLRVSSLPMAFGAVAMCYLLARRVGLTAALSAFIALTLGLSPLFMPLAATFMTDVPALFFMLLSMYAILRGFENRSRGSMAGWLMLGAISALVGGSNRQLVWIVPLVVLPYFAWLRRRDMTFIATAILGWLIVILGAAAMQHWYAQQPYALPDPPAISYLHALLLYPKQFVVGMICVVLTMVMMLLPAALGTVRLRLGLREAIAVVLGAGILIFLRRLHQSEEPWLGNIFTSHGVLNSVELSDSRPYVLFPHTRMALSLAVMAAIALLLASAILWIFENRRTASKQFLAFFLSPDSNLATIPAMVLLSLALFGLEMTRVISQVVYDRHLLPFIPFLLIPLLMAFQVRGLKQMPIWSWMLLVVYAAYAIASTQEVNSLARARVVAINRLEKDSVAPTQIDGGFEHRYWTQAVVEGHVNDARIRNPAGAYQESEGPTPAMKLVYRLELGPNESTAVTSFGTVPYLSWLPPFHRKIYLDRYKDPWWLDPVRAATRPAEKPLLPDVLLEQYKEK